MAATKKFASEYKGDLAKILTVFIADTTPYAQRSEEDGCQQRTGCRFALDAQQELRCRDCAQC